MDCYTYVSRLSKYIGSQNDDISSYPSQSISISISCSIVSSVLMQRNIASSGFGWVRNWHSRQQQRDSNGKTFGSIRFSMWLAWFDFDKGVRVRMSEKTDWWTMLLQLWFFVVFSWFLGLFIGVL